MGAAAAQRYPTPELMAQVARLVSLPGEPVRQHRILGKRVVIGSGGEADFVLMVKPQFEVGRQLVGDGVVRDPELRASAVAAVAASAAQSGLGVLGVTASPLPGPSGNVEYFLWLRRGAPPLDPDALSAAVAAGPR